MPAISSYESRNPPWDPHPKSAPGVKLHVMMMVWSANQVLLSANMRAWKVTSWLDPRVGSLGTGMNPLKNPVDLTALKIGWLEK